MSGKRTRKPQFPGERAAQIVRGASGPHPLLIQVDALCRSGQWEEAEAAYRNAIARADELHLAAAAADAELRFAQMLFKTRNLEGARTALQAAERRGIDRLLPERLPALRALAAALEPAAGGSDGGVKAPDAPP